jgi:hypothetical protein
VAWYADKKLIVGSAVTVVVGIVGWYFTSSSNSITGVYNSIVNQGQTTNNFLIPSPAPQQSQLETNRRKSVVTQLRQKYVFSHDKLSPGLLAGTEPVPADWMNKQLEQLGEAWRVRVKGHQYEFVDNP